MNLNDPANYKSYLKNVARENVRPFNDFIIFLDWFEFLSTKGRNKFARDNKIQMENQNSSSMKRYITLNRKDWLEEIKGNFEDFHPKYSYSSYNHYID